MSSVDLLAVTIDQEVFMAPSPEFPYESKFVITEALD